MANPLYHQMNNNNMMSNLQALKSNPMQYLMQKKFSIPQNLQNDPNAIIQHLLNSGQVTQQQYNKAKSIVSNFNH